MCRKATESQAQAYAKRKSIQVKISALKEKLADLERQKRLLDDDILIGALSSQSGERKLPNGKILRVSWINIADKLITADDVGKIKTKGYSYAKFTEV